jgi:methylated-DNA-protein-cysteine methyltransferase-like protein
MTHSPKKRVPQSPAKRRSQSAATSRAQNLTQGRTKIGPKSDRASTEKADLHKASREIKPRPTKNQPGKHAARSSHLPTHKLRRALRQESLRPSELRDQAFRRVIRSIPKGKVATYGQVAAAAGYPLYHRAVARLLRNDPPNSLPWQRVLGAGGEIKLRLDSALEQRFRLELEGVTFSGKRVNLRLHQHQFRSWEL